MKTLVVDDSEMMRRLLQRALERRGHAVVPCEDGDQAWDIVQRESFDLILSDWILPTGIDGLELSRRIRALPGGDRVVILVVTANDRPEDLAAALDAGADDYLAKPFTQALLAVRLTVAERQVAAIAARLEAQQALVEARTQAVETAALRELSRQQRRMLTLISHELNTPLSLWYGFSQLLASREEVPEPLRQQLEVMHQGATRLKLLVANMTELIALEGPAVEVHRRTLDLGPLVAAWVADAGGPPRIELSIGSDLPRVSGDSALLEKAVAQLIGNGLKFSAPDTTVWVGLERRADDLEISVSNEGVPIPKRELDRLFDPLYRTEEAERQAVPGPGLGLALVHRIADLHGGSISAANTSAGVRLALRLPPAP